MVEKKILFISYYTANYKHYADKLIKSFKKFKLDYDVRLIDDQGGWRENVRYKPSFILAMMQEHPETDAVVWIDADGVVLNFPALFFKLREDLGVFYLHWPKAEELLSGTMYVRNRPASRRMMHKWIAAVAKCPETLKKPEQQVLQSILPSLGMKVKRIPQNYCQIENWRRANYDPVVISHSQASRLYRYSTDGNPVLQEKYKRRKRRKKRKPLRIEGKLSAAELTKRKRPHARRRSKRVLREQEKQAAVKRQFAQMQRRKRGKR